MRHLATALGVQPSALYWHFPNKQALLAAVSERILAPVHEVVVTDLPMPEAVLVVGGRMHESLLAYRDASELVSSSLALGLVDSPVRPKLLIAARTQGVPDALSDVAAEAVMHFVVGYTFHEQQRLVADALGLLESDEKISHEADFVKALTMIAEGLAAPSPASRTKPPQTSPIRPTLMGRPRGWAMQIIESSDFGVRAAVYRAFGMLGSAAVVQRLVGSRMTRYQLKHSNLDDEPTVAEILAPEWAQHFARMLVDERDESLLAAIDELIETRGKQEITVAITYGAQHMRAVINHLYGRSFRVIESDWFTVTSWV